MKDKTYSLHEMQNKNNMLKMDIQKPVPRLPFATLHRLFYDDIYRYKPADALLGHIYIVKGAGALRPLVGGFGPNITAN